jgi:hypothetical protein
MFASIELLDRRRVTFREIEVGETKHADHWQRRYL